MSPKKVCQNRRYDISLFNSKTCSKILQLLIIKHCLYFYSDNQFRQSGFYRHKNEFLFSKFAASINYRFNSAI